ncbi:MAG: hypothetical protein ACYDBB_08485 [Armatimonadota bacterium]
MALLLCVVIITGHSNSLFSATGKPPDTKPETASTPREFGNTFQGFGSANWSWGRYPAHRFAISFHARQSKTLECMWICWKTAGGYGAGTLGVWNFELQTDATPGHTPSGKILSKLTRVTRPPEGYFQLDLPPVAVRAGEIYHLVMYNIDPEPGKNWSSPNTIMSVVGDPWQGEGVMSFDGATWSPWGSQANPLTPGKGSRAAYLIKYTDGTYEGMPYYSATERRVYRQMQEGEEFLWQQPTVRIATLGIPVYRIGKPTGALNYTIEEVGGATLATGELAAPDQVTTIPQWRWVSLPVAITLEKGKSYRLSLGASKASGEGNCYAIVVPYATEQIPGWHELTWGGRQARHMSCDDTRAWRDTAGPADMTFSLTAVE